MVKKKLKPYEFPEGEEPEDLIVIRKEIAIEEAKQTLAALKANMSPEFIAELQLELARQKLELQNWDILLDQDWDECVSELESREHAIKTREEGIKIKEATLQKIENDLRIELETWATTQREDILTIGKVLDKMAEYVRKQGVGSKRVLYAHLSEISRLTTGVEYKWNEGTEHYTKIPAKYAKHELDRGKLISAILGKGE